MHSSANYGLCSSIAEYAEGATKRQIGKSLLDMARPRVRRCDG
jgi:hypothetical protein